MQIALVAVVLLAGMWFTVLKPKPADDSAPAAAAPAATPASAPAASAPSTDKVAPGVKGLASAVDKAKAASATSDQANAKIQAATGGSASTSAPAATASTKTSAATPAAAKHTAAKSAAKAKATKPAAAKTGAKTPKAGTKAATATTTAPATGVDPSERLLAYLKHGKTLVILFEGKGADDKAARKAVHQTALKDPKHVVSAYVPINQVGKYEAITSDVQVLTAPTILVISTDGKATPLTGYVDATVVRQAVADARRAAAATK
jgi:hypothetical protein